ncbi:MAG: hypothetical protein ACR2PM_00900, partial [Hyphomicrobiales bacterium]
RLEGLAAPGGLCISGTAHDTLRGALAEGFADSGERTLKNISRPIRTFSWHPVGAVPLARAAASSGLTPKPALALGGFEPLRPDPESEALAAAVRAAVQTSMSNLTGTTFLADPERADYVLSASFQAHGQRYRATAMLQDRHAGKQFWSERFDGEASDPFDAQDELAARISGAMRFAIYSDVFEKRRADMVDGADSETVLSQAGYLVMGTDAGQWLQARAMTGTVIEREPENFMAWAIRALSHLHEPLNGWRGVAPQDLAAAGEAARRAVQLNGQSDFAHWILALVHMLERDLAAARREAERSLEINPHFPLASFNLAQTMIFGGEPEDGIALARRAAETLKRAPMYHGILHFVSLGHFVCRRYQDAIQWAERAQLQAPGLPKSLIVMTAAAVQDGDMEAAEGYAGRLLEAHPDFSLAALGRLPFSDPEPWDRLVESLRRAGLPDGSERGILM